MSGKASKTEVAKRVEAVFELRLGGAGFADIREYAAAPTDRDGKKLPPWGVSDTQLWRYIAKADELCQQRFDAKAKHLLARHLLRRERLYAHAVEVADYRTALAVLKDQAELEGHYKRDNHTSPVEAFLASLPPNLPEQLARHLLHSYPREELRRVAAGATQNPAGYPTDPAGYAEKVLRARLMGAQSAILRHLLIPPCIVNVPSGNSWGKTYLGAVAISWWFDSFDPGVVYALGPRKEHVVNVLWGQLRILRSSIPTPWVGPKAPGIYDHPAHFAIGMTASRGESFRGRHLGRKLFVIDEATSPEMSRYFDELPTMLDPATGDAALLLYNPDDTTSRMYLEDQKGSLGDADAPAWHRFRLNCLEHPNVVSQLKGGPILYPGAVNLAMVEDWVRKQTEPVAEGEEPRATDVAWPLAKCPCCAGKGKVEG